MMASVLSRQQLSSYLVGTPKVETLYTPDWIQEKILDLPDEAIVPVFSFRRKIFNEQQGFNELEKHARKNAAKYSDLKNRGKILYGENRDPDTGAVTVFLLTPRVPKIFEADLDLAVDDDSRKKAFLERVALENENYERELKDDEKDSFMRRWATPLSQTYEAGRKIKVAFGTYSASRTLGFYIHPYLESQRKEGKLYRPADATPLFGDERLRAVTPAEADVRKETEDFVLNKMRELDSYKEEVRSALEALAGELGARMEGQIAEKASEMDKRIAKLAKYGDRLKKVESGVEEVKEAIDAKIERVAEMVTALSRGSADQQDSIASLKGMIEDVGAQTEERIGGVSQNVKDAKRQLAELVGVKEEVASLRTGVQDAMKAVQRVEEKLAGVMALETAAEEAKKAVAQIETGLIAAGTARVSAEIITDELQRFFHDKKPRPGTIGEALHNIKEKLGKQVPPELALAAAQGNVPKEKLEEALETDRLSKHIKD